MLHRWTGIYTHSLFIWNWEIKIKLNKIQLKIIYEQNLVGVAIGAACRDRTVAFVSTFATFFSRAFDQIRMGAISQTNVNFVGSHCGVSIGEDGPSQMGLEVNINDK